MDIEKSIYTDLVFHVFAHMKINNASDIYDETYIAKIEKLIGKKTVIPKDFIEYYCSNFERLAFINFLPYFKVKNVDELCYMISHTGITTDEDNDKFIKPFCNIIRDISEEYIKYNQKDDASQTAIFEELKDYIEKQSLVLNSFFDRLYELTKMKLKVVISDSLRCNGRASGLNDTFVVILPAPSENYSKQEIFMQLVHECTHVFTDRLINSIHMDDGSHDIAEYQVILFDLWLFQRNSSELCNDYIKWLSIETLEECNNNLSHDQKIILREYLDAI